MNKLPSLVHKKNFLSKQEQAEILSQVDKQEWILDLKRRVQHYGYKYDYRRRSIDLSMSLGPLPDWLKSLQSFVSKVSDIKGDFDQVIVNEYLPGQGIAHHVDCEPCFGELIVTLSLGSSCIFELVNLKNKEKLEYFLEPGDLVSMSRESRYEWKHGIPARKSDNFRGLKISRGRRVFITFRQVILQD